MALQLFRLASKANSLTTTKYDYFSKPFSGSVTVAAATVFSISLARWSNNAGSTASVLVSAPGYDLCINGVLQEAGLYVVHSKAVQITVPAGGMNFQASTPVTLQAVKNTLAATKVAVP